MLMYRRTSLLESSAQTLVNTVNCVGVMGKGIAHECPSSEALAQIGGLFSGDFGSSLR
jgi:hypothetical protein